MWVCVNQTPVVLVDCTIHTHTHSIGESVWWTVHPASKARSEGEKVRVGDDVILVSVATERYLVSTSLNACICTICVMYST